MPNEAERHLRERLNRLRGLPLLRGTRLSGELERLQRQLERIEAEPTRRGDLAVRRAGPSLPAPVHPRLRRAPVRGLRRAARRPGARRGSRARDRARPVRRQDGRGHRPAEGTRHRRAHPSELRHGAPRGLPEGDADDGDRAAPRVPARDVSRLAGRLSGRRGRAARPGRCDRPFAGADGPPDGAARRLHHRRGELGRRDRDRARRPGAHAGKRDVQRDLARGLRRDSLAGRRREGQGGGRR